MWLKVAPLSTLFLCTALVAFLGTSQKYSLVPCYSFPPTLVSKKIPCEKWEDKRKERGYFFSAT